MDGDDYTREKWDQIAKKHNLNLEWHDEDEEGQLYMYNNGTKESLIRLNIQLQELGLDNTICCTVHIYKMRRILYFTPKDKQWKVDELKYFYA